MLRRRRFHDAFGPGCEQATERKTCIALSISYGQKHVREIEAARAVAAYLRRAAALPRFGRHLRRQRLLASGPFRRGGAPSPATPSSRPNGDGGPVSTYVPFRNGLFLSSAASMALSLGCSAVYYGAHHDDWAGNAYPDCSLEFVEAMNRAIVEGTGGELRLEAPVRHLVEGRHRARGAWRWGCPTSSPGRATKGARRPAAAAPPASTAPPPSPPTASKTRRMG